MAAFFALVLRLIGWGGVAFLALLFYEEGIPGAGRIPFLSSIPILGDVTTGRVHSYAADQVKLATAASEAKCLADKKDMVAKSELEAEKAKSATEARLRTEAEAANTEAQRRADAAKTAADAAQTALDALSSQAVGLPKPTAEERKWLDTH